MKKRAMKDQTVKKGKLEERKINEDLKDTQEEITIPNVGQFIVIKLATKKCLKHFIGRIEEVHRPEVVIKYLRQKKKNCFVFPVQDDISLED